MALKPGALAVAALQRRSARARRYPEAPAGDWLGVVGAVAGAGICRRASPAGPREHLDHAADRVGAVRGSLPVRGRISM